MATYFSVLSILLGTFLMPGSPLISARDIPASEISLVQVPDAHYYLVKKNPAVLTCRAKNAAEITFTCMDSRIPETSVEAEGVSYIDPGLIQAKIEVTRADVQYYGGAPFWCTCSAVDFDGGVAVTSTRGYVSIAFLKNKFTVKQARITATVNDDVEIPCGAPEAHPKPDIIWRKDKKKLEMDNNPRLGITEEGALLIQSVTAGDDGLYQCVVRNVAGRQESKGALLKVLALEESSEPQVAISEGDEVAQEAESPGKPRTTRQTYKTYFISEPQENYYVTENTSVLIDCSVVAADILTFRCNNKRMEKDRQVTNQGLDTAGNRNIQSQLRLTYADIEDFRAENNDSSQIIQCTCVAWYHNSTSPNGWGRIDSISGHGFVHVAYLKDVFHNEPSNVTAAPNTDVTMVCEPPEGEPFPWVHWYKDGSRLDPRSSNKYLVNVKGHLKIRDIQREDAGAYHCVVENVAKTVQSKVGLLTVIDTAGETTTAGQPAEDAIPEFPEVIPNTPVFLRDFQPQYTVDRDGTRTVVCAVISAEQLTMECGGRRLAGKEVELKSKVHQESGKYLLQAKTEITAETVAKQPDTYFCQCTAWLHNRQQSVWEQVYSAEGYFKLTAARTEYIGDVFAITPEDTDAYFEAEAKLVCKPPMGDPTPEVHWLKDGVRIDSNADPNYVIVEGELLFQYVRVSDEGHYTCVAENEAGTRSSKTVQFTVLGKPAATTARSRPEETSHTTESSLYPKTRGPFFNLSPDPKYYIIREQSVNMSCTVIAATYLVFVCNGEVVQSTFTTDSQTWDSSIEASINKNSLVITKENVDLHTGSEPYTCVCRAYYEEEDTQVKRDIFIDSSQALIQIAFLENQFLQEPSDTDVTFLGTAELVCKAPIGIPEPTVYWLKNGYKISGNERIQVKDSGSLVINTFTEEDEGSYTCVAENFITSRTSRTAILSLSDDVVTNPAEGHTPETAQPEPESTTHGVVQRPYFDTPYISKDLQPQYFLVMDKPVTITCEAYGVESITFTCGMQSVEDLTVHARVEQQVRSNGQTEPVTVFEASVNVSKEKVESYEVGKEYSCHCFAHYRVSATGEYQVLNSTKAVVQIAYLNAQFEKEPESHTVTEGGFLTIYCNPPQGNPEPMVWWIKDGQSFVSANIVQNNLLVFTETELEHTGEYICVAENVAGKRQSSPIFLEVKAKSVDSMAKGDTDDGGDEFDVYRESDEEPGTNITEETGSTKNPSVNEDMTEHVDEEEQINIDVLQTQQQEDSITEIWSAKNVSRQNEEEEENYLEKNQIGVLGEETDSEHTEEYDTEDILEGHRVNEVGRQKTDVAKCEQMLSQCMRIFPSSADDQDVCLVLPQHISCIQNYISNCVGVADDDTLDAVEMEYKDMEEKCSLQPKCPQLERCASVSSAVTRNHLTVEHFCQHNTLLECVDGTLDACNATLSQEEEIVKTNLQAVGFWLTDFCEKLIYDSKPLASCDEMMACDLHIEQTVNDNTASWCKLIGSLVECTNRAISKCQLNELRNDLEELDSNTRIICTEDDMGRTHSGPLRDITPELDSKTTQPTTQVTQNDRITVNGGGDDEDDDGKEVPAIEGGAAASKEGAENGSAILCVPVLLATILQLLTLTLYLR